MEPERNSQNIDELLADLHRLLDDQPSESTALPDEDPLRDYKKLYQDLPVSPPAPQPAPPKQPSSRSWAETQKLPRHVAKLQRNQEQAYADWLYEQGRQEPAPVPQKRHRRGFLPSL